MVCRCAQQQPWGHSAAVGLCGLGFGKPKVHGTWKRICKVESSSGPWRRHFSPFLLLLPFFFLRISNVGCVHRSGPACDIGRISIIQEQQDYTVLGRNRMGIYIVLLGSTLHNKLVFQWTEELWFMFTEGSEAMHSGYSDTAVSSRACVVCCLIHFRGVIV